MKKTAIIGMLALLVVLVIPTTSAAASEYYLTPQDSSVPGYCQITEVELWINATEPIQSGFVEINYTFCCANITDYSPNFSYFEDNTGVAVPGQLGVGFSHRVGFAPTNQPAGVYHLGNFTIHCCNEQTTYCETDLLFTDSLLGRIEDSSIVRVEHVTTNGTFTCGEPVESECLGDCYNDAGALVASNVPCYDCIGIDAGVLWENYEFDSPCAPGTTVPRRSYDHCPQCCDGENNDGDTLTDWPADPECACCLDETEDVDEGCPGECVPELPTLALASIGILGAILLARKRE